MTAFEERETNISARYFDGKTRTILSLYIYRPGNPSSAIWFDRALNAIGAGTDFGDVEQASNLMTRFRPSGATKASGLSAVFPVENGNFRSTGGALYRAGQWLVKVRISSAELSTERLDAAMRRALEGIPALEGVDDSVVEFVVPCDEPLVFGETAPIEPDTGLAASMALMSDVISAIAEGTENENKDAAKPVSYCREGEWNPQYNVYRPIGQADRYSLVFGDSGSSVEVYPFLLTNEEKAADANTPTHLVSSSTGTETSFYTPFRGMPGPGPASRSAFRGPVYAKVNRRLSPDENPQITISAGPSKEEN